MPLDEATRRLVFLLQRDMRRLIDKERARADRGEQVRYDTVSRMATWETRRGDVIGRWYGEVIANYVLKDRILRWSWAGRAALATATHAEMIFREGQTRNVPQLSMSVIGDIDEDDAGTLARLGILVSRGEGIELHRSDTEIAFIGLFDSPRPRDGDTQDPSRYSVPPPPVATTSAAAPSNTKPGRQSQPPPSKPPPTTPAAPAAKATATAAARQSSPPPGAPYRSLPPIREIYGPRTQRPPRVTTPPPEAIATPAPAPAPTPTPTPSQAPALPKLREPARGVFLPVATAVHAGLTKMVPGFKQALFVITVDPEVTGMGEKRRLVVVLVAVDAAGALRQIDPSHELVEMAARMVEADRVDGNGRWRKLSARITPKADGGATLNVDVL